MKKNPSTNDAVDRRPRPRLCGHAALATLAFATLDLATAPAIAQPAPPGFVDEFVVGQLDNPTALAFAPDGRLVITEQGGTARLVSRGNLQTAPFARLTVDGRGERGLLGVAFHPELRRQRVRLLLPHGAGGHDGADASGTQSGHPLRGP